MKKLGMCFMIWLVTQAALLPAAAACPEAPHDGYLVKLAENAPVPMSAEWEYVLPGVYWMEEEALAEDLVDYGIAEYAEPNYQVTLCDTSETQPAPVWAYTAIQASVAADYGITGAGVRIAVIDSGLDLENPNLENARIAEGYDYTRNTTEMTDTAGHGTYVTQMIAGDGDAGLMQGIAPGATIVPLRCFGGRTTDVKTLVQAIEDAVDPDKFNCDIINMSWGEANNSVFLREALQKAYDAGVHLVAAAGNVQTGLPQGTMLYPAAWDTVIGVGSVEEGKTAAPSSQQTPAVDLCAPGHGIPVCGLAHVQTVVSGTSFATPCVSAVLALILETAPDMSPAFAAALLCQTAEDLGEPGRDDAYGHGFVAAAHLFSQERWSGSGLFENAYTFWLPAQQQGRLYAAFYTTAGRLQKLSPLVSSGSAAVAMPAQAGVLKVFAVTDHWVPQKIWLWGIPGNME